MATLHFRSMCLDEAQAAGLEGGDLIILYNDVKTYLKHNTDEVEELLDAVAVAYEEDKAEDITDEIGMRVISAIGDHSERLFEGIDGTPDPFEDEEQIYHQKAAAAALLDLLVEVEVIKLPEGDENSHDEDHEDSELSGSGSE